MKTLKIILIAAAAFIPASGAYPLTITGGEVRAGAVADTLVYQGRLEKDSIPVSDTAISATSFNFSVHSAPSGSEGSDDNCACSGSECSGNIDEQGSEMYKLAEYSQRKEACLWYSDTVSTHVVSGIFSVSVKVPWQVFSFTGEKYLEVKVGGVTMSPRTKIGSVPYALIAKKLEDNASIKVSSMSIVQGGNIYLKDGCVVFNNNDMESRLCSTTTATQMGGAQGDYVQFSARNNILFNNGTGDSDNTRSMIITSARQVGIGTNNPDRMLTVNGDVSIEGKIYGKGNNPVVIGSTLSVTNGIINAGAIKITDESISLNAAKDGTAGNSLYLSKDGKVGIGTDSPEYPLHVQGRIYAAEGSGIKAGDILIGADSNVISAGTSDLYLQSTGNRRVAIGTRATNLPSKLVVEGGLRTDSMTVTGSSVFNGNVEIKGSRLVVNNGVNTSVHLSSTVIYGNLSVHGKIGLDEGEPAYINNSNEFISSNTFKSDVTMAENAFVYKRMGVGVNSNYLDFGDNDRYLQVGDGSTPNNGADVYLLGGSAANSSVRFYHGSEESSRITTDGTDSLKFVVNGSTVASLSQDEYLISRDFRVAKDAQSSPALYVHGSSVAINTLQPNENSVLTVNGQMSVGTIVFKDGTSISSKNEAGNPSGLRSNDNVVIDAANKINLISNGISSMVIKDGMVAIGNVGDNIKAGLQVDGNVLVGNPENISFREDETGSIAASGSIYSEQDIKASGDFYLGDKKIISSDGKITNLTWNGSTVDVSHGGTGRTNLGTGILKGNADGTAILTGKVNLQTEVQNILPIENGGTGHSSFAGMEGPLRYDGGASFSTGTINLSNEASGLLPLNHGGTNQNLASKPGILRNYGSFIGTDTIKLNAGNDVEGILQLSHGGTGKGYYDDRGILYYDGEIKEIVLAKGQILIGGQYGIPAKGTIEGTNIDVDTNENGKIKISIPQSVAKTAVPEFAGLKLTGAGWTGWGDSQAHILTVNSEGTVGHSSTIDLSNVSGILPAEKGGTGSGESAFGNGGPVRAETGTDGKIHLKTGQINMTTESTGLLYPINGGLGHSEYAAGEFVVAAGDGTFTKMKLSDGQIFIGNTNGMPSAAKITSSSGRIAVASTGGSIDLSLPQAIDSNADVSFRNIKLNNDSLKGGFLRTSASGNIFMQETINLAEDVSGLLSLSMGGTNQNLASKPGILRNYGAFIGTDTIKLNSNTDVAGILPISRGGTGRSAFPAGILRFESGMTSLSTGAVVLDGGEVTGVLPMSNGGTGSSSIAAGVVHSDGSKLTSALVNLNTETTGILPIGLGGTGRSSFTANGIIYARTASELSEINLAKGYVLAGGAGGIPVAALVKGDADTGVIVDTGTAGVIQISAAQNINKAADPEFAGLKLSGLSVPGFVKVGSDKKLYSASTLSMSDFTGILPAANGGTGKDSAYFAAHPGPLYANADGSVSSGTIKLGSDVVNVLPVANGGTGRSYFAANSLIYAGSTALEGIALGRGQVLIGVANGTPVAATLTPVANQTRITSSDGSITIGTVQDIAEVSSPTFAGLSLTGFDGVLKASAGTVSAGKITLDNDVSGVLPVDYGGTGQNMRGKTGLLFSYDTVIGTGTLNLSESSYFRGRLGILNGGTNASSYDTSSGNVIKYNGTSFVAGTLNLESSEVTGTLPISRGGTGTDSITSNKVIITNSSAQFAGLPLSQGQIVMGNAGGAPVAGNIEGGNGLTVSTEIAGVITLGMPQPLAEGDSPTFNSLVITGVAPSEIPAEGGYQRFIVTDELGRISSAEISTADVKGIIPVSKGGTGASEFDSNAIIVTTGTAGGAASRFISLKLEPGQILASADNELQGLAVIGSTNGTTVDIAGGTMTVSLTQNLSESGMPTFAGLTLSGLPKGKLLATDSSGTITTVEVLGVGQGGTGNGNLPENSLIVNYNGVFQGIALADGEFIMGDADGKPAKYQFAAENGVTISTSTGNITISASQNLLSTGSVTFAEMTINGNLSASTATVYDVITASSAISANSVETGNITVSDKLILSGSVKQELGTCDGSKEGAVKYCIDCTFPLVLCSDRYGSSGWIYVNDGNLVSFP